MIVQSYRGHAIREIASMHNIRHFPNRPLVACRQRQNSACYMVIHIFSEPNMNPNSQRTASRSQNRRPILSIATWPSLLRARPHQHDTLSKALPLAIQISISAASILHSIRHQHPRRRWRTRNCIENMADPEFTTYLGCVSRHVDSNLLIAQARPHVGAHILWRPDHCLR